MKRLCCSKLIWLALFWALGSHAALTSKSAALYYGKEISYPTVGIHNYVFAEPDNIVTASHGYKVYGSKIYVKVDPYRISAAKRPSKSAWIYKRDSFGYIMDMRNDLYRTHVVKTLFADLMKRGFKNFYIDSLDIYQETAASKTEQEEFGEANIKLLEELRREYPQCKFIVKGGEEIIEKIHPFLEAVVIDSYMYGLDKEGFRHAEVSQERQKRVDRFIEKLKSYKLDIVTVEYTDGKSENEKSKIAEQLAKKGLIPVIVDSATVYSSTLKSANKREILVLIDETQMDRIFLSPHQHGTLPLEFYGYKVKFYEVSKGLPPIEDVAHYAGVIVWIIDTYKEPREFIDWVLKITQNGTKIAFANNFGIHADQSLISPLGIEIHSGAENYSNKHQISYRDKMIGYEVEPSSINTGLYYQPANAKALLIFEDTIGVTSTPAAIMPWGGYAMSEAFMMELKEENIWIINPFEFFKEALRLEPILVPDATTENGRRLLFTHVDGDGIMNRAEWNSNLFSGQVILDEIIKKYKIPHSISVIGAEIDDNGLFPDIAKKLQAIARDIYKESNVEAATHTFTHPFEWGRIDETGDLSEEFRLKVPGYKFRLDREIGESLRDINKELNPKSKPAANTVFWSGDCAPPEKVLKYIYENNILSINGGDTTISNTSPWLANVAPLGLERGEYQQIYTGAQNENVFTNDWLGPFWGFKRVVQTFELTDKPKRLKPIDIYYHLYSGSKTASLNALRYIFDWAIKQDVMPIFTSEYIPKAMDFYTLSLSNEGDEWLVEGTQNLRTLRYDREDVDVDIKSSSGVVGYRTINNSLYIHLDNSPSHRIKFIPKGSNKSPYLISSNAKIASYSQNGNGYSYDLEGHVDVEAIFHMPKGCKITTDTKNMKMREERDSVTLNFANNTKARVNVQCE